MEYVKKGFSLSKVAVLVLASVVTGCASNQTAEENQKPAELVQALEKISSTNAAQHRADNGSRENAFKLSGKADAAYENENWKLAEKYYRSLTRQVPQDAYGYFQLGNVLMQLRKVDGAIEAYNEALKREPNDMRALKNRSLAYLLVAENSLERTAGVLSRKNDPAADGYLEALMRLQRLNGLALSESVSPVQGLYLDQPADSEETFDASGQ